MMIKQGRFYLMIDYCFRIRTSTSTLLTFFWGYRDDIVNILGGFVVLRVGDKGGLIFQTPLIIL